MVAYNVGIRKEAAFAGSAPCRPLEAFPGRSFASLPAYEEAVASEKLDSKILPSELDDSRFKSPLEWLDSLPANPFPSPSQP